MSRVENALLAFKDYVRELEYTDDTLALDRALGEASTLLYDVRHAIDFEWAAARASNEKKLADKYIIDILDLLKQQGDL